MKSSIRIQSFVVALAIGIIWGYLADLREGNMKWFVVRVAMSALVGYLLPFVLARFKRKESR